jgi:hypothetical protein
MVQIGIKCELCSEGLKTLVMSNKAGCNTVEAMIANEIMMLMSLHMVDIQNKCLKELGITGMFTGKPEMTVIAKGGEKHG